jgi:phosphoglycolate phosphatase-like HAD superfamily hydrolase
VRRRPTACVFDLDGPLLDVSERYYRLYCDLLRARGLAPLAKRSYWAMKRRRVPEETIFERSGGRAAGAAEYARARVAEIEDERYLLLDRTWPPVPALLRYLSRRARVILASARRFRPRLQSELDRLGIAPYLDDVLSVPPSLESLAERKAARVRAALGEPRAGWLVGDTETDVRAGRLLGLRTVAVSFGIRRAAELSQLAPDELLATPEELLDWARSALP